MKLTAALLLVIICQVNARTTAQTVTYSAHATPLPQVFAAIKAQTGYSIFYDKNDLAGANPVTVDLKDVALAEALKVILTDEPLGFYIQGTTVFITQKPVTPAVLPPGTAAPSSAAIDVHGRVTDSLGRALAGASVTIKGTRKGTSTDANGNFELKGVEGNAILVISFTGFESREIKPNGQNELIVQLRQDVTSLQDVVVNKGYYTTTNRLNTGDVTTITSKEIETQPISNPLLALQGLVPGLYISQQTGFPGTGIQTLIQGQNSIQNGNDPFYVVDGVPYPQELLPNNASILGLSSAIATSSPGNPLSFLNPSDIESITVLKDADATAIYGSRAANGAIIITTKKGKPGKTKIEFNLSQGTGHVERRLPLLNTKQYLEMRHEALNNDGDTASLANGDYDLLLFDTTRNTDWQKVLLGGTSQYSNFTGTLSGGNAFTQYLISGTFHRETTVFPDNCWDQKGSVHFSLSNTSENKRFMASLSSSFLYDDNRLPGVDLTTDALQMAPDAPSLYNKDGSINWALNSSGSTTWPIGTNPIATLRNTYEAKTDNLVSDLNLSYTIITGLQAKVNAGFTYNQFNDLYGIPISSNPPQQQPYSTNFGAYTSNNMNTWTVEPQLNYANNLGIGRLEALAGGTITRSNLAGQQLVGVGYTSELLIPDLSAASNVYSGSTTMSTYKYNGYFGRLGYTIAGKYILNLTERRDGSSRFGSNNAFHDFGSIGGAWLFGDESFVKNHLHFISFGKLRASYGTTGNDQIGDYGYLSTYNVVTVTVPYQGVLGLTPTGLSNPNLQWEETRKLSLAMEWGFLKDRLFLNSNYFRNRSSNELLSYKLPSTTGFSGILLNFPATIQNSGWEFTLRSTNVKTKDFQWSSSLALTIPNNKLVAFPNLASSSYSTNLIIGKSINIHRLIHLLGVNDSTGLYQFASAKGSPTYSPSYSTDNISNVSTDPKYFGSLTNSVQYKNISLIFNFYFMNKLAYNYYFGTSVPGGTGINQPTWILNRWQKIGDNKPIERFNANYSTVSAWSYANSSDAAYSNASFIRLKNLALTWALPSIWMHSLKLESAKLFIQAQNLFVISNFKGLDPETGSTSLPPLRTITGGINLAF